MEEYNEKVAVELRENPEGQVAEFDRPSTRMEREIKYFQEMHKERQLERFAALRKDIAT